MTTIEKVLSELDHNDDNVDMQEDILRQWAHEVLDEVWKGYDLALCPEDQQMMDRIMERVKSQI